MIYLGDFINYVGENIGSMILGKNNHNNGNFKRKFGPKNLMYYGEFCWWYVWIIISFVSNFLNFNVYGLWFILPLWEQMGCESGISIYMLYWNVLGSLFCSNFWAILCMGICFHYTSLKNNIIGVEASFVTNEIVTKMTNEFIENEIRVFWSFMTLSSNLIRYATNHLDIIILTHSLH